jgi:hypothetical protein
MIGHGSARRRRSYLIPIIIAGSGNGVWNALLGRMGQILIIVGSGVDRENLTAGQRNAATSASRARHIAILFLTR